MSWLESLWLLLYNNLHPFILDCVLPYLIFILLYILFNSIFLTFDVYGCPKWFIKFKIEKHENNPISRPLLKKALKRVAVNLLFITPILEILFYYIRRFRNCSLGPELPSTTEFFITSILCIYLEEIMCYCIHRCLHHPYWYQRFHKKQHEWTAPCTLTTFYSHPVEHILLNYLPFAVCPVMLRFHTVTLSVWYFLTIFFTTFHHSGYEIPLCPSSEFKNYHYKNMKCNFGVLGYMDFFFGTHGIILRRLKKPGT